jgi:hypothetical protein
MASSAQSVHHILYLVHIARFLVHTLIYDSPQEIITRYEVMGSRGSSGSIVSDNGLSYRGSVPDRDRGFFFYPIRPDWL